MSHPRRVMSSILSTQSCEGRWQDGKCPLTWIVASWPGFATRESLYMTLVVMCEEDIDIPSSSFLSINTFFILNHAALSLPYVFLFVYSLNGANLQYKPKETKVALLNSSNLIQRPRTPWSLCTSLIQLWHFCKSISAFKNFNYELNSIRLRSSWYIVCSLEELTGAHIGTKLFNDGK